MLAYHGTTHQFDSFDLAKSYDISYVGRGFYFSSSFDDARGYAGFCPDVQCKIDNLTDQLMSDHDWDDELYDKLHKVATSRVLGERSQVLVCKLYVKNPIYLSQKNSENTFIQLYNFNEEEDDIEWTNEGEILRCLLSNYYGDEFVFEDSEISAKDLYQLCVDANSDNWGEVFNDCIQQCGFDAIIMRDAKQFFGQIVPRYNTNHVIVFDSNQVQIIDRVQYA